MDEKMITEKLNAVKLGKTYLYVLIENERDLYCVNKQIIFFANKVDAMVFKLLSPNNKFNIIKFDDVNKIIKNLLFLGIDKGAVQPAVSLGFITSSITGVTQFVVGKDRTPCFHIIQVPKEEIEGGFDLNNFFMHSILDDEMDENKIVQQLIFSNLSSDSKLEEVAKIAIEEAKKNGIETDKKISIRQVFAYENEDLHNIWGVPR